eukprot:6104506-Pleurochrysis_carterae.AAC.1
MPKVSAAGMERVGSAPVRACVRRVARSAAVSAPWVSASRAYSGHLSVTSHAVELPWASVVNA